MLQRFKVLGSFILIFVSLIACQNSDAPIVPQAEMPIGSEIGFQAMNLEDQHNVLDLVEPGFNLKSAVKRSDGGYLITETIGLGKGLSASDGRLPQSDPSSDRTWSTRTLSSLSSSARSRDITYRAPSYQGRNVASLMSQSGVSFDPSRTMAERQRYCYVGIVSCHTRKTSVVAISADARHFVVGGWDSETYSRNVWGRTSPITPLWHMQFYVDGNGMYYAHDLWDGSSFKSRASNHQLQSQVFVEEAARLGRYYDLFYTSPINTQSIVVCAKEGPRDSRCPQVRPVVGVVQQPQPCPTNCDAERDRLNKSIYDLNENSVNYRGSKARDAVGIAGSLAVCLATARYNPKWTKEMCIASGAAIVGFTSELAYVAAQNRAWTQLVLEYQKDYNVCLQRICPPPTGLRENPTETWLVMSRLNYVVTYVNPPQQFYS